MLRLQYVCMVLGPCLQLQHRSRAGLAGAAAWSRLKHHSKLVSIVASNRQQPCQPIGRSPLCRCSAAAHSRPADSLAQASQYRQSCSQCPLKQAQQPCTSVARQCQLGPQQRLYHSLMTAPTTTAADAPGLANLQGLLHVYKQSLANVGRDAVEQLRHTLAPSEDDDLHDEDTGNNIVRCPEHA